MALKRNHVVIGAAVALAVAAVGADLAVRFSSAHADALQQNGSDNEVALSTTTPDTQLRQAQATIGNQPATIPTPPPTSNKEEQTIVSGTDDCDGNWVYAPRAYRSDKPWKERMPFSVSIDGHAAKITYADYSNESGKVTRPEDDTDPTAAITNFYGVEAEGLDGMVALHCKGSHASMQFLHSGPEEYIELYRNKDDVITVLVARHQMAADGGE